MHRFLPTCRRPSARTLTKLYNERPSWLAQAHAALDAAVAAACAWADYTPQMADEALQRLKDGNARFAAGQALHCDLLEQVRAAYEAPSLYDENIGDLFVARVAGNIASSDIVGSLEFAAALAGAKLIVVFGHSECGAVKGAIDDAKLGSLTGVLQQIRPSLKALDYKGVPSSKDKALVQRVAERNAKDAAAHLTGRREIMAGLVRDGKLKIVHAMHDLATAKVSWFG